MVGVSERVGGLGEVPYQEEALERTAGRVRQRRAGEIPDRLALLSHPPVITYGSRTPPAELPADSPIPAGPRRSRPPDPEPARAMTSLAELAEPGENAAPQGQFVPLGEEVADAAAKKPGAA